QTPGPNSPTLAEGTWLVPILSLVGGAAAATVLLGVAFYEPTSWAASEAIGMAALLIGLSLWFGAAVRLILGILKSPLRAFTTLPPLYLLRVRGARLRVYPLFRLSNIRAVHQHTNGAYTHTTVNLSFGPELVHVVLRGKGFAEGWVQFLLGSRGRALELMAEGYLEAEHGVDLLQPSLLNKVSRKAEERGERLRFFGRAAAVGAVCAVLTIFLHGRAA